MTFKWNANDIRNRLEKAARAGVVAAATQLQANIKRTLSTYSTPRDGVTVAPPGGPPGKRTGALGRSIVTDNGKLSTPGAPHVRVGTNLIYARIQEFGGVVSAKNVKALPIPVNQAARRLRRQYETLRAVPQRGWIRDNKLFFNVSGRKGGELAVFKLEKSVRIPARPYLRPTHQQSTDAVLDIIRRRVTAAAKK